MDDTNTSFKKREVPKDIRRRLRRWQAMHIVWRAVHLLVGITGIVSATIIGAKISILSMRAIEWLAWSSVASTAFLTAFSPGKHANDVLNAWRHLDHAVRRYELDETYSEIALLKALNEGEKIIGDFER